MQTDQFVAHVYESCPQLAPDVVHQCTLITLDSLCEQLPKDQTKRMAEQLPDEIADAVRAGGDRAETSYVPISLDEFYGKICFRTELDMEDAQQLVSGVVSALEKALDDGEVEGVKLDLPSELDQLMQ
ncbi:DUF2267 domain-containing protein [Salinisphaera sp. SPP-AMP-43]|uniref:DUF2267 domain-containing protein n=1 Tax=Salinisphaera sp. SPP-AMP-43 TaxID=3121288 RepID=UPI003C6E49F9